MDEIPCKIANHFIEDAPNSEFWVEDLRPKAREQKLFRHAVTLGTGRRCPKVKRVNVYVTKATRSADGKQWLPYMHVYLERPLTTTDPTTTLVITHATDDPWDYGIYLLGRDQPVRIAELTRKLCWGWLHELAWRGSYWAYINGIELDDWIAYCDRAEADFGVRPKIYRRYCRFE